MTITAPRQRQRELDEFCASHSGGGGFMRFAGDYRPWSWIKRNCVCAHCGARPRHQRSHVSCFGHYRGATYFQCDGAERHLLARESDLKWRVARTARDEAMRPGEVKAVHEAYPWIYTPSDTSDVDW